jgi:uridine kinase
MIRKLYEYLENETDKVVVIDGPSGAGKSTLANKISEQFDVLVIHTDDYFLPKERKTKERLAEPGGNIDYERMISEIFYHLQDETITSNHFNCQLEVLEKRAPQKKKKHIIIEGVYSMHPLFDSFIDYRVYLDVNRETQLSRIKERSGSTILKRFVEEWIPLEDNYFDTFKVKEKADLIVKFL